MSTLQAKLFISFLLSVTAVLAEESEVVAFYALDHFVATHSLPQSIKIRGFLYETADHHLVLAAEPNLKSCCVGSVANRYKQIVVVGDPEQNQDRRFPAELSGKLRIDPQGRFSLELENSNF